MSILHTSFRKMFLVAAAASAYIWPAYAAPQQALNKTVHLSWTFAVTVVGPSGARINTSVTGTHNIYISSAGRLFDRGTYSVPGVRSQGEGAPGTTQNDRGEARSLRFEGDRLVGDAAYEKGARHFVVTFDPAFSSCTVSVIVGRSGGEAKRKGPDGVIYTIESQALTSQSCSVQGGNALG
jgi:hypothetical protein